MKKFRLIIIILSLAVVLSGAVGCDEDTPAEPEPAVEDTQSPTAGISDFNLIFKYGVTAKNELDTFKGTYTKDMISDPPITIELSLTEAEKDIIYRKMLEIDFFNYPDEFSVSVPPGKPAAIVTPHSSYYFKVEYNSQIKELRWKDEIMNPDEKANRLRELIIFIRSIVESKEEYQKLPEPTSAYL
jgi:hypothetical protein